jgi:hypothetical protein
MFSNLHHLLTVLSVAGVMLYFVSGAFEMVSLLNLRTNENEPLLIT